MRSLFRTSLVLAAAVFSASPALAQFTPDASEQTGYADDGGYAAEATSDDGYDAGYAGTATDDDPYAADPAYDTAPPRPVADRTVGDIAASILGAKAAQHAQDIGAIVGDVTRKGSAPGTDASPSSGSDAVSLIRGVLNIARKKKAPQ